MNLPNEMAMNFVEDYRNLPCLWRVSDPYYKDSIKRKYSLLYLADKYCLNSENDVINQIEFYCSVFHSVHLQCEKRKKIINDHVNNIGIGNKTQPIWFLYNHLKFLIDEEDYRSRKISFNVVGENTNSLKVRYEFRMS